MRSNERILHGMSQFAPLQVPDPPQDLHRRERPRQAQESENCNLSVELSGHRRCSSSCQPFVQGRGDEYDHGDNTKVQVDLVIGGLFIYEFAYSHLIETIV